MERLSTGIESLDRILGGGFPARAIHILMGQPGTGKTILAEHLAFTNAGGDRPVLYLTTLSEPLAKFITYLQEYSFADVSRIGTDVLYESIGEEVAREPEKMGEQILRRIQEHRPRVIIIDSFKATADLMPDLAAWRRTLFDVAGILSAYDTTSFWVGEYTADMTAHLPEFAVADGIVDLTRAEHGSRDDRYLRVLKLRGSDFLDGSHAFRITNAGLEVFRRLVTPAAPPDYTPSSERLATGISGLDDMIESGWLRGTTTLVAGPSGSGKTGLGLHFLREGAARGEPGLLVNFQENPTQLARIIAGFGWHPSDLIGPGKLDVLYTSPVELQIDTIVAEIFRRVKENGVRRVVIDALGDLEKSARDPLRFRDYIYALTQHLAARNITSMLPLETAGTLLGAKGVSGHEVSYMSDNILLLEMHLDGDMARTIRVIKSRGSKHDGSQHPLRITGTGIVVE